MNSKVKLVPLVIHQHKNSFIVEASHTEEFYEMSPASVDAILAIQDGMELAEIERSLTEKYPEEDIDILEFINNLIELELLNELDGQVLVDLSADRTDKKKDRKSAEWPNKLGRFLFRTPMIIIYFSSVFFWLWSFIKQPALIPDLHSMHMFGSMTVNVLIWASISLCLLAFHEFSHFLAARSYDVPAKYTFGHRMYFLVLETDISSVWKLQPKQRVIPYIAGMLNDSLMLSISIGLRMWYPSMPDIAYELLELAGLYLCVMLVFQLLVFLKTDMYYVIETISGTLNLKERTSQWLVALFKKNKVKEVPFIKFFSVIYVCGLAFSVWLFVNFAYPQFLHFLEHARDYLSYPVTDLYFWDGVLFLLINGAMLLLLFYSWMRQLREYVRSRLRVSTNK